MGFPWEEVIDGMGLPILIILLMLSPAIVGALIGQIARLIRNIFSRKDDDDE